MRKIALASLAAALTGLLLASDARTPASARMTGPGEGPTTVAIRCHSVCVSWQITTGGGKKCADRVRVCEQVK